MGLLATHILKKDFIVSSDEIYKKGSPVYVPKRHHKHFGFCCNAAFLTKTGKIKVAPSRALSLFSLDHFKPKKDWFEPFIPEK